MRTIIKMRLIILVLIFQVVYSQWLMAPKEVNYLYKRTECKRFNPKYGYRLVCPYKFFNRSSQQNSLEMNIHPGIKIYKIELTTYKKFGTVFRPTMIKLKENFCDVVANKTNSFFAQQLRILFTSGDTNFDEPCPLMGKKYRYGIRDSDPISGPIKFFPPLIPIGEWKVLTELYTYMNGTREFLIELADFWEVSQKTATQF